MMELKFTHDLNHEQVFKFEKINGTFITSQPFLMDPFEQRMIYFGSSTISGMVHGDGIFAKKNIPGSFKTVLIDRM